MSQATAKPGADCRLTGRGCRSSSGSFSRSRNDRRQRLGLRIVRADVPLYRGESSRSVAISGLPRRIRPCSAHAGARAARQSRGDCVPDPTMYPQVPMKCYVSATHKRNTENFKVEYGDDVGSSYPRPGADADAAKAVDRINVHRRLRARRGRAGSLLSKGAPPTPTTWSERRHPSTQGLGLHRRM